MNNERIKELRKKIREITRERRGLLMIQREYKRELFGLLEVKK